MDYVGSTLLVFAILIVVAIAAVSFEPANPFAVWEKLAQRYVTERRPMHIQFTGQPIMFGGPKGKLTRLNDFVMFDTAIDDFGLWLIAKGLDPEQQATAIKIPGTHIRPSGQRGQHYLFELYAEPPVRIGVRGEFGEALAARCNPSAAS